MKRIYTLLLLFLLIATDIYAQKEDYTWVVGDSSVKMVFTDTGFTYDTTFKQDTGTEFFGTSFTANDSAGNLLFYTNGASVFDKNGDVMENGDGLNPSSYLTELVNSDFGNGFLQGAMGIPKPGSDSLYYLFHFGASDSCPGYPFGSEMVCTLYLTTINTKANNGLGVVIEKNYPIMQDSLMTNTEMTLIKHGNGKDWWLIKHGGLVQNRYYEFLINSEAISGPIVQDMGSFPNYNSGTAGTATISPDGTKFAGVTAGQKINIFDFDRCTGLFSNPDTFNIQDSIFADTVSFGCSLAFSPDSRYLYVDYVQFINQYDLYASNVATSKVNLMILADSISGVYQWFNMQLAPDGRIYINPYDGFPYLSVINYPDSPGLACGFVPWSVALPCAGDGLYPCNFWGVPSFPQYRLPTLPVYLAVAGPDNQTCKDTLVQVGSAPLASQLIYNWSSSDLNAYISDIHSNQPNVSTRLDSAQFYLQVIDTVSKRGCVTREDTVTLRTNLCIVGILQTTNPIRVKDFPYLYVYNIAPQTSVTIYNLLGQLIYTSNNYQNDWDVRDVANAVYVFQIKTIDGQSYNGKVVVVH